MREERPLLGGVFTRVAASHIRVGTFQYFLARQDIEKEDVYGQPDYWEWNLSATVKMAGFDLTVAYTATDIAGNPDGADDMVLFTVSRSF